MGVKELLIYFLDSYLVRRNLEDALSCLSDHVISLGTGVQEVALNKEELRALMIREFKSIPGGFVYRLDHYQECCYKEDVCGVYCSVVTSIKDTDVSDISFQTRLTMTAAKFGGQWKIINMHMSAPSDQQEDEEFFPIKYGRQAVGKLNAEDGKKLVEIMLSMLPGGIMGGYLEKGFPLYIINDTMLDYLGYTYDELVKETGEEMEKIIEPEDLERVRRTIYDSIQVNGEYDVQYRIIRKDGTRLWVDDKGHAITTEDGRKAMISVMLDINDSMHLQEKLLQETMEDSLTGILNRRGATAQISSYISLQKPGALFMMDIDNFKMLNDTYGHQCGDHILILLAKILKDYSREGDVAARIGGDEFILYLPECVEKHVLEKRAENIGSAFQIEVAVYDRVPLSVSIGIAVSDGKSGLEHLFKTADDRLYAVKKSGKGTYKYQDTEEAL